MIYGRVYYRSFRFQCDGYSDIVRGAVVLDLFQYFGRSFRERLFLFQKFVWPFKKARPTCHGYGNIFKISEERIRAEKGNTEISNHSRFVNVDPFHFVVNYAGFAAFYVGEKAG